VSDKEFELLLGRARSPALWDRDALLEPNDTFAQLFYSKSPVGRFVHRVLTKKKTRAEERGEPVLDVLFIYNMPFRAVAKNAGGFVSPEMVAAILLIFNGHFFRGFGGIISGFFRKRKQNSIYKKVLRGECSPEKLK
jgi:beta-glucosidase